MAGDASTIGQSSLNLSIDLIKGLKIIIIIILFLCCMYVIRISCNLFLDLCILHDRESAIRTLSEIRRKICPWWHPRTQPQGQQLDDDIEQQQNYDNDETNLELLNMDHILTGLTSQEKYELLSSILVSKTVTKDDLEEWKQCKKICNCRKKDISLSSLSPKNEEEYCCSCHPPSSSSSSSSSSLSSSFSSNNNNCDSVCNNSTTTSSSNNRMICPICINHFEIGCKIISSNACTHIFHKECLSKWLCTHATDCPYCRTEIITQEMMTEALRLRRQQRRTTTTIRRGGRRSSDGRSY